MQVASNSVSMFSRKPFWNPNISSIENNPQIQMPYHHSDARWESWHLKYNGQPGIVSTACSCGFCSQRASNVLGCHHMLTKLPWLYLIGPLEISMQFCINNFQAYFSDWIFKLISVIDGWYITSEIVLRWMSLDLSDDKSILVQVMAWCHQATSHYLSQCGPRSLSPYGIIRPQ